MKEILIKSGKNPTFRVPPKMQIDLIRNGRSEMFFNTSWEKCAFASSVIEDSIFDPNKTFAGVIEGKWGWFNSFGANTEDEVLYQAHPDLRIGKKWRDDELLIEKLRNNPDFVVVCISSDSYSIQKTGRGEQVYEGKRTGG